MHHAPFWSVISLDTFHFYQVTPSLWQLDVFIPHITRLYTYCAFHFVLQYLRDGIVLEKNLCATLGYSFSKKSCFKYRPFFHFSTTTVHLGRKRKYLISSVKGGLNSAFLLPELIVSAPSPVSTLSRLSITFGSDGVRINMNNLSHQTWDNGVWTHPSFVMGPVHLLRWNRNHKRAPLGHFSHQLIFLSGFHLFNP